MTSQFLKLSDADYFAHPAISKSSLSLLAKCPAYYRYWSEVGRPKTKAMDLGSAVHCGVLEPELFNERYVMNPGIDRRSNAGKAAFAEWQQTHVGKTVLSEDEWYQAQAMIDAVKAHPLSQLVFKKGLAEHAAFWKSDIGDINCKAKADWIDTEHGILVDLKTTENASYEAFQRSMMQYGYGMQLAYYLDGCRQAIKDVEINDAVIIAVESKAPYLVGFYRPTEAMLEHGRREYRRALETYHHCVSTNDWPGLPSQFVDIDLPGWLKKEA
jgi:hypothetical protein